MKLLYNSGGREAANDWKDLTWVSDGPTGQRPQYKVGDELLLYNVPTRSFPARARVTVEPVDNARLVNQEGGLGEGKRWPYVTRVRVLGAVDLNVSPTPKMLGVAITQGGHRRINAQVYRRAVAYVPGGFRHRRLKEPLARPIPIEKSTDEPFEQRFEAATRKAYRREQILVERLERHLRQRGHEVSRHAITLPDGTEIRSDLTDHDTGLLVEAKATAGRASIRMAIGQLADYVRFIEPAPKARAVLVPERPAVDLIALLDELEIGLIWFSGGRFRDNRDGQLV
jgi:hypothetical protein